MKLKGSDAAIPKPKARDTGRMKLKVIKKERGMKLEGCDAAIPKPKPRDIGRISVRGFDSGLPREDVESALREHFASCGKITDVYIAKYNGGSVVAYIYFVGEGAVDKALKLNGSDVGGREVCAKAYPFHDNTVHLVVVKEYSTSLSDTEIEVALREFFSSCGEVQDIDVGKGFAGVYIKGFDAADKARELDGSYIGRSKVAVRVLSKPPRYTVHDRRPKWGRHPLPDMMAKNKTTAE